MHNSYNQFYSTVFCLLYMFRTNLVVHHQEHSILYSITQFGTIGTIVQASLAAVSNESSGSSSGAQHNILYCTVWYNRYNRAIRQL